VLLVGGLQGTWAAAALEQTLAVTFFGTADFLAALLRPTLRAVVVEAQESLAVAVQVVAG
jgi:hypothetical protein